MLILSAVSLHKALRRQPKCAPTSPVCPSILSDRQHPRQVGSMEMSGRARNNKLRDEPRLFQTGETDGRHAPCITSLPLLARPAKNGVSRSVWQVLSFLQSRCASTITISSQPSIYFTAGASVNSVHADDARCHRLANGGPSWRRSGHDNHLKLYRVFESNRH